MTTVKSIPFKSVPAGQDVPAQPDGYYITVCYGPEYVYTRYMFYVPNVFPWSNRIYKFEGGLCDELGYSSNFEDIINMCDEDFGHQYIKMIFLVGLSETRKSELIEKAKKAGISLVEHTN